MSSTNTSTEKLLEIMQALRTPGTGCPWDLEQTFASVSPYTIEEAYEVDDAIQAGDMGALKSELGDLLFQVVFHAQMADEAGEFSFGDVVQAVSDKMITRHPHVFGGDTGDRGDAEINDAAIKTADDQTAAWEVHKQKERANAAKDSGEPVSALDGVALALPALLRAVKLQKRAARIGFDWPEVMMVVDKIREESLELATEIAAMKDDIGDPAAKARAREEFGDLMFVQANLARHLDIDPEHALRDANAKFVRRFKRIEALLMADGRTPEQSDLTEMDNLWNQVKLEERAG